MKMNAQNKFQTTLKTLLRNFIRNVTYWSDAPVASSWSVLPALFFLVESFRGGYKHMLSQNNECLSLYYTQRSSTPTPARQAGVVMSISTRIRREKRAQKYFRSIVVVPSGAKVQADIRYVSFLFGFICSGILHLGLAV